MLTANPVFVFIFELFSPWLVHLIMVSEQSSKVGGQRLLFLQTLNKIRLVRLVVTKLLIVVYFSYSVQF